MQPGNGGGSLSYAAQGCCAAQILTARPCLPRPTQALRSELEAAQAKLQSVQQEAEARAAEAARLSDSSVRQQEQLAALEAALQQEEQGRRAASGQVQVRQLLVWGAIAAHCFLCSVWRL